MGLGLRQMNFDHVVSKIFYFFFFAAFGSLFPLLGVFFKQLGFTSTEAGIILGLRPIVEICSTPLWGGIADKFRKGKIILLCSLGCWIIFTLIMSFIHTPASGCIRYNGSDYVMIDPWYDPNLPESRKKRSVTVYEKDEFDRFIKFDYSKNRNKRETEEKTGKFHLYDQHFQNYLPPPNISVIGQSPLPLDSNKITNIDKEDSIGLVSPLWSSLVYKTGDVKNVFFVFLILVIVCEFFSSPAFPLADSAVLGVVGETNYEKQRLWGSIGWALAMFFIGIGLDNSDFFYSHPCGNVRAGEKNYTVCFVAFCVFMFIAMIVATQFHFIYDGTEEKIKVGNIVLEDVSEKVKITVAEKIGIRDVYEQEDMNDTPIYKKNLDDEDSKNQNDDVENKLDDSNLSENNEIRLNVPTNNNDNFNPRKETVREVLREVITSPFVPRGKPGQSGTMPGWISVLQNFQSIKCGSMLFITWFMGVGAGLIFTFLFWHLQDIGGGPTLFGIASIFNHVTELAAYMFSQKLVMKLGHINIILMAVAGNCLRFIVVAVLTNAWVVLPFEFLQGLTHAALWAALCSYITQATPAHLRSSTQFFLHGFYHCIGRGCGAIFGGILISYYGTAVTFLGYGICSVAVLGVYVPLTFFLKNIFKIDEEDLARQEFLQESSVLAPSGVPMNPMPKNPSSSNLPDLQKEGSYGSTGGNSLQPEPGRYN